MTARAFIVAAPHSGAGKTTVTLALLAALRRRGLIVHSAKAGPDYIDPAFHTAVTGAPSVNLDSWAMSGQLLDALAANAADGADVVVIEGVMGLFDGAAAGSKHRRGATADLAAHFGLPVVLVLDVARQAQSAAAVVRGFASHDPAVRIAGVILNRVASERHRTLVADAIAALDIPVLGALPRETAFALPERHLGLVQAGEHPDLTPLIDRLADTAERHIDLDGLLSRAGLFSPASAIDRPAALPPPGQRIALARDQAFSFVYPHVIDAWRKGGAEILPFSPLADKAPPAEADSCWLPGGYPELARGDPRARAQFRRWSQAFCRDPPGPWRVRRLHGAGREPGRRGRPAPPDDRPARPLDELRQAQAASRLSHRAASFSERPRRRRHGDPRA